MKAYPSLAPRFHLSWRQVEIVSFGIAKPGDLRFSVGRDPYRAKGKGIAHLNNAKKDGQIRLTRSRKLERRASQSDASSAVRNSRQPRGPKVAGDYRSRRLCRAEPWIDRRKSVVGRTMSPTMITRRASPSGAKSTEGCWVHLPLCWTEPGRVRFGNREFSLLARPVPNIYLACS